MKATKIILIGLFVVAVVIAAAVYYVWSSLDTIVAAAIEKYGSEATQTQVSVDSVQLALTEGKGAIAGLSVANPPGFSAPHIFKLGEIGTNVDIDSVTKDPIVIDAIAVRAPEIYYEVNQQGQSNVKVLQANMGSSAPSEPAASESKGEGKPIRLIIRKFVFEEGKIDAQIAALPDKGQSITLPRVELSNLGEKQGGATPQEIAHEVVSILLKQVGTAVAKVGLERYVGKSAEELKEQARDKIKQEADKALGKGLREGLDKLRGQ